MQPVFVGDVQGCADELDELIRLAEKRLGSDAFELWLVGDLVNRGPDSLRVLERVRPLVDAGRARVVVGNHEIALLEVGLGLRKPSPTDTFGDVLASPAADAWLDWVRGLPLVETGRLGERPFAMAHAAVAPSWSLAGLEERARRVAARLGASDRAPARTLLAASRSDPDRDALDLVTRCRAIDARGAWSDREPARPDDAWHRRWSAARHAYGVVYGHWATQGLHVAENLRGLDTGCVHHGRGRDGSLTAWVPDLRAGDPFALPERGAFWSVRARRPYYRELLARLGVEDSA
jgi:bis(5'-nucleosyl)-tetraphosphatase (symmetrical)